MRRSVKANESRSRRDRKSTRLNSSHPSISYAVFCLKKKIKPHHSLSDGIGLLQLLDLAHGHSQDPGPADDRPMPEPRRAESPEGLLVNRLADKIIGAPAAALRETVRLAGRFVGDPIGTTSEAVKFAMSLRRVLTPPDTPHSPALTGSGSGYRLDTFDVAFDDLKAAGRAAGGSVNDA